MSVRRCPFGTCAYTTDDDLITECDTHGVELVSVPSDPAPPAAGVAEPPEAAPASEGERTGGRSYAAEDPPTGSDGTSRTRDRATGAAPRACRHCGAEVPHAGNTRCLSCRKALAEAPLRLSFAQGGVLEIDRGQEVRLGRALKSPAEPYLRDARYVSREHAVVGMDADGSAWIRDTTSKNATTVNDRELDRDETCPLRDGDTVLIGRVQVTVKLTAPPP